MKKQLGLLFIILLGISSCMQSPEATNTELPEDLAGLKTLLKEKKNAVKTLEDELAQIEAKITELDPSSEKLPTLVTTESLSRRTLDHFVSLQGSILAKDLLAASSETGGRITSMYVKEGQYVQRGKMIAKIDLEVMRKQLAEVQKSLELANDVYEKQSRLWDQKIGSEIQYLQAKNNKERLEKSIESIEFQLTKSNVYAPISGTVERVFSKAGEMASPGAPIVQILDTKKIKAVVDVPENYLRSVNKGQTVSLYYPAIEIEEQGRISDVGRVIDPANRTFKVEIDIKDKTGLVKPNLLVEMKLNDFSVEDAVILPLYLVQEEVGGKKFVYTTEASDDGLVAKKIYIQTGQESDGEVVVVEGMDGKEELIIDGAFSVVDNELIQIQAKAESDDE